MKAIFNLFVVFEVNEKNDPHNVLFFLEYCFLYNFKIDFSKFFYPDYCTVG